MGTLGKIRGKKVSVVVLMKLKNRWSDIRRVRGCKGARLRPERGRTDCPHQGRVLLGHRSVAEAQFRVCCHGTNHSKSWWLKATTVYYCFQVQTQLGGSADLSQAWLVLLGSLPWSTSILVGPGCSKVASLTGLGFDWLLVKVLGVTRYCVCHHPSQAGIEEVCSFSSPAFYWPK